MSQQYQEGTDRMNLNPFRRTPRRNARPARHAAGGPADGLRRKFRAAAATDAATSARLARLNQDRSNRS
jgi:hypothetical protein